MELSTLPKSIVNEDGVLKHWCGDKEETVGIVDPEGYCRRCGSEFEVIENEEKYKDNLKDYEIETPM